MRLLNIILMSFSQVSDTAFCFCLPRPLTYSLAKCVLHGYIVGFQGHPPVEYALKSFYSFSGTMVTTSSCRLLLSLSRREAEEESPDFEECDEYPQKRLPSHHSESSRDSYGARRGSPESGWF